MSLLVSLWILLPSLITVHISPTNALRLLLEEADTAQMKKFDRNEKPEQKSKLNLGHLSYVEGTRRLLTNHQYAYRTPYSTATAREDLLKKRIDEPHRSDDYNKKIYSGFTASSTRPLMSFSSESRINKSSPASFSDYSQPRMRSPSHN
ncbi:hypothetical protein CDL15_Pgr021854 [Punica granatum]|nr:hypothetical protein CDL15_Pgr021854 [Punica granatum]PKI54509.1 hypothetical protein CRG98_025023 [Punica granatum]